MIEIPAIETKYNGYRFRSRLEARWAVFFDSLGVAYEYEPEGFDLTAPYQRLSQHVDIGPGDVWYLPDFYLPDYDYYVEIKPLTAETVPKKELDKCWLFSKGKRLLLVVGLPGVNEYGISVFDDDFRGTPFCFAQGRKCDRLWLVSICDDFVVQQSLDCSRCSSPSCGQKETDAHAGMVSAYDAARSARF